MSLVEVLRNPPVPKGAKTMEDLIRETGLSEAQLRYRIRANPAIRKIRVGKRTWYVLPSKAGGEV